MLYLYMSGKAIPPSRKKGDKMRKETAETKTKKQAAEKMPWACKIAKVEGGYKGFEDCAEYKTWKNQI